MWGAKEQGRDKGRCVCVSFIRGRNHTALYLIINEVRRQEGHDSG